MSLKVFLMEALLKKHYKIESTLTQITPQQTQNLKSECIHSLFYPHLSSYAFQSMLHGLGYMLGISLYQGVKFVWSQSLELEDIDELLKYLSAFLVMHFNLFYMD